jgi:hypothetical protein
MKITSTNGLLQILALSATMLCAGAAAAQGTTASGSEDDGWVPVRHLEFKPEDVEGSRLDPGGSEIVSVPRAEHRSLIEIRAGFEAEIIKTMENM